jgi:large subunit ribosomal protein L29
MARSRTDAAELDPASLDEALVKAKQELFNLRFQHATGQLENTARLGEAKRELARGLTVANERGLDVERELKRQSQ